MKILKLVAFVLGGIAALFAAAVLYVAITFDAARVKEELKRVVLEQKQRTLEIEGDVDLSFYPNLGLKLGKAALSEHNSADRFAAIDSAHVSMAVLPLLSGALVIDEIRVDGASVNVIRYKDGSLNIDDLMSSDAGDSSPVRFDIAGLRLSRSALVFRDEGRGAAHALDRIELSVGKLSNAARDKLALSAYWTSEQPVVDSHLVLAAAYDYDVPAQRYALERVNLTVEGRVLDLSDLRATLALDRLAADADERFDLQKLSLDAAAKKAGETLSARLSVPALQLDAAGARGDDVSLAARIDAGTGMADIKLQLRDIEGSAQSIRAAGLTLALDARLDEASVKAALTTPISVQIDGPSGELSALDGSIDIVHPALPMKSVKLPVSGTARADFKGQTAALDLDSRLDDSRILLKLAATRLQPPALTFDIDIDIDQLDLDRYLPRDAASAAESQAERPVEGRPDDVPVDLSALRDIDARGSLKIGQLQVSGVKMTQMRLDVKASNGRLDVAPYSASLYQGGVSGALNLNADGNRIALKQTLSDIDVHPLIRDVTGKDMLEGRGSVVLDVAAAGATVGALKRSLDGKASLKLRDGAMRGIDLMKSVREAKARLGGGSTVQQANLAEKTDFSTLDASFRIDDGIVRNADLVARSRFLRLAGSGSINLPESSVDYRARVTLAATDDQRSVTVPIRLSGPFDRLDYRIEFGELIKRAVRGTVDAQRQTLQDKAREAVQEPAGGAFKNLLGP